jgi:hypothetical protein
MAGAGPRSSPGRPPQIIVNQSDDSAFGFLSTTFFFGGVSSASLAEGAVFPSEFHRFHRMA